MAGSEAAPPLILTAGSVRFIPGTSHLMTPRQRKIPHKHLHIDREVPLVWQRNADLEWEPTPNEPISKHLPRFACSQPEEWSAFEGQIYHHTNLKSMIYAAVNVVFAGSFYLKCFIVHQVQMISAWMVPQETESFSAHINLWLKDKWWWWRGIWDVKGQSSGTFSGFCPEMKTEDVLKGWMFTNTLLG